MATDRVSSGKILSKNKKKGRKRRDTICEVKMTVDNGIAVGKE